MAVSIQCEPGREVAQHPRHGFHIHAILEGQRGERMAEVMKPDLRQARPIQHPMEHMKHAVWGDGPTGGAGEHLGTAGLLVPLLLQNGYRICPQRDGAVGILRFQRCLSHLAVDSPDLTANPERLSGPPI